MRSTEFMSPPSRGFDLLREAALSLSQVHRGIAQLINPRQTQAVRYADSALSSEGDALPAGPLPGEVMAEQQLEQGHLTDWIGPVFTLLVLQPGAEYSRKRDDDGRGTGSLGIELNVRPPAVRARPRGRR